MSQTFTTREINFSNNDIQLAGTLTLPEGEGPHPIVVLVHGSGEVDRNENTRRLPMNIFAEIATMFANNGIATLRFDKRGIGQSGGDYFTTGLFDQADDALAAFEFATQHPEIDSANAYFLGHSVGSNIIFYLAANKCQPAGLISVAGALRSGESLSSFQARHVVNAIPKILRYILKFFFIDIIKLQKKSLAKIKNSKKSVTRANFLQKINLKWMREFLLYDPSADFANLTCPILAIHGDKDLQSPLEDQQKMLRAKKSDFTAQTIPDLTHILRRDAKKPSIRHYKQLVQQPVDQETLSIITAWLLQQIDNNTTAKESTLEVEAF